MTTWPNDEIITIFGCIGRQDENDGTDYELYCPGGLTLWGLVIISKDHSSCSINEDGPSLV